MGCVQTASVEVEPVPATESDDKLFELNFGGKCYMKGHVSAEIANDIFNEIKELCDTYGLQFERPMELFPNLDRSYIDTNKPPHKLQIPAMLKSNGSYSQTVSLRDHKRKECMVIQHNLLHMMYGEQSFDSLDIKQHHFMTTGSMLKTPNGSPKGATVQVVSILEEDPLCGRAGSPEFSLNK
eukprot:277005_1